MRQRYVEEIEHEVIAMMRRADFKRTLDGSETSMDRSAYLLLKWLEKDGPAAIGAIAEAFQLDHSTISRQIAALEGKGWIQRTPSPEDARISVIGITETGAEAVASARSKRTESYGRLLQDWTDEEVETFSSLLTRLNRTIDAYKRRK
ncbi:MarR family winged helix-turn-helix transcriptional regulator [Paenibacillus physcomitrellae]|uniref:MarR family transcriptional regulator n=1 Tax=Paenibacillus physcomitrellae TaxID=1619311 RepID=A0ABQ1FRW4_9BACL|nr:MarR family transcriptional regulator [Paenibacillus physcomitrellae]GGA26958.1 MarR family transcriptional regulator [Paenibacillus physcomitrellae]